MGSTTFVVTALVLLISVCGLASGAALGERLSARAPVQVPVRIARKVNMPPLSRHYVNWDGSVSRRIEKIAKQRYS